MKTKIVCIIPSYCSSESYPLLKKCIESLIVSAKECKITIKIVIVSNGKKIVLKDLRTKIIMLVRVSGPYSFAKMNNIAIDKALRKINGNWILLINDDAFVEKNFFKNLLNSQSLDSADIVVPLIYEREGPVIDSFGVEYFKSGYARNASNTSLTTQSASASCLLIKSDLLKKAKTRYGFYFNQNLISYMEDVDLTIRCLMIGGKILKNSKMKVHHLVSFTSGKNSRYVAFYTFRNIIWLIIVDWPIDTIIHNIFKILLGQIWIAAHCLIDYDPFLYFQIWVDTIRKLPTLLKNRKRILLSYDDNYNFKNLLNRYTLITHKGYIFK